MEPNPQPPDLDLPAHVGAVLEDLVKRKVLSVWPGPAGPIERPETWPSAQLARRYAANEVAAAQAAAVIDALAERLAGSEWHRSEAERTADELRTRFNLGQHQLILSTDDEPGDGINALLDITTGRVWARRTRSDGQPIANTWQQAAERTGSMQYEWPIETSGPFIAVPDDWCVLTDAAAARRDRDTINAAQRKINDHVIPHPHTDQDIWGYIDTFRNTLPEMVTKLVRQHEALCQKVRQDAEHQQRQAAEKIALLEKHVAELRAELAEDTVAHGKAAAKVLHAAIEAVESGAVTHDDLADGNPAEPDVRWGDASVVDAYNASSVWMDWLRRVAVDAEAGHFDDILGEHL